MKTLVQSCVKWNKRRSPTKEHSTMTPNSKIMYSVMEIRIFLQNKTPENESVKKYSMRETKTEIDCKSPIKSSLSNSIKPRPERKNAVSSFSHV